MPINYLDKRPRLAMDTECFPNLWAIGFRSVETGKIVKLRRTENEELDRKRVATIMRNHRVYTFNGINYDIPMILLAMSGASCWELKAANDRLIVKGGKGLPWWKFFEEYGLSLPDFVDHVDLMQVAPSAAQHASLKKYAGMMHSRTMMESRHDFNEPLSDEGIEDTMAYLDNDLEVTCDLIEELTEQVAIRAYISTQIGVDVRSKSDAQTGEAIMQARVKKRTGSKYIERPEVIPGKFKFECPSYVQFKTPYMQAMLDRLLRSDFTIKYDGYVQLPEMFGKNKKKEITDIVDDDDEELEGGSDIIIDGIAYKMGIGGLHSKEKAQSFYEDDDYIIVDIDVTGYYPNLIIKSEREPDNMKGHYQVVYKGIVVERAQAKAAGDKAKAEQGKIASNGLFGKAGSPYSIVYAPRMLIQTTVSGQLSLLMLIEEASLRRWRVISANTDGIVLRVPRNELGMLKSVVFDWEYETGLNMEYTYYRSIHSVSVNTYMAFKKEVDKKTGEFNGKITPKRKGKFAPSGRGIPAAMGLKKSPELEIAYDAAVQFVLDGTPPESTVRNCQDIRKFVTVKNVKGGAQQYGEEIAKVVRFYYGVGDSEPIYYVDSGNKVPRSEGAVPCMVLPKELPDDIDYEFYEREAFAILHDAGMVVEDPSLRGRTGQYFGRLEDQKTVHIINAATGVACCGRARPNRRDQWVEYKTMPASYKLCGKCSKESL